MLEVFLLSRLFEVCSAFRPWFPPREWLESCLLCLQSPCFCCFFAAHRFFALSFCAAVLRPASLCLLVCLVFSPERSQRCLLTAHVFVPGSGLRHVFVCEAVGVSAGRRFFVLCLRGGSSPSDLSFSGVLIGLLVEQPRFARRAVA